MLFILLSFNYSPPPPEVIRNGQFANYVLFSLIFLVPNVKYGAWIGAIGSACIAWSVQSYAGGDIGNLSQVIDPPIHAVKGAILGGVISYISKAVYTRISKSLKSPGRTTSVGEPNNDPHES
jgi:hypothetical protein